MRQELKVIDGELEKALASFFSSFECVFDGDWEYSKLCLQEADAYIKGSFLNPCVEDEFNNWANRGGLLTSYRHLMKLLAERKVDLTPPNSGDEDVMCRMDTLKSAKLAL